MKHNATLRANRTRKRGINKLHVVETPQQSRQSHKRPRKNKPTSSSLHINPLAAAKPHRPSPAERNTDFNVRVSAETRRRPDCERNVSTSSPRSDRRRSEPMAFSGRGTAALRLATRP
ncbi:hypothetical protein MHYP_G00287180 [Metynnis hypsauchen]